MPLKTAQCPHHKDEMILLVCVLQDCPANRLCCVLCADDSHSKHDLISLSQFQKMMLINLQVNRSNPDKFKIINQLNSSKADLLHKLQLIKNKLLAAVGKCQDAIQQYYSKIFHSFAIDSHPSLINRLESKFTSDSIQQLLKQMKEFQDITLGNFAELQTILHVNTDLFKNKISIASSNANAALLNLFKDFTRFTLAKPKQFIKAFSKDKRQTTYLTISDSQTSVMRSKGNGGYPLCLLASPFDPINSRITFLVQKIGQGNKRSICLGACLGEVVKANNYSNCVGFDKGIYAIDQCCPYTTQEGMLASWNHHDTAFNQTNVGNNNLVGWSFKEGDKIRIEVDYYNSVLAFIKGDEQNWQQSQEAQVYEMPIKLDAGPIYAFVSGGAKGDQISIIE